MKHGVVIEWGMISMTSLSRRLTAITVPNREAYLFLYRCDGKLLKEVYWSKDVITGTDDYRVADLDGDGFEEVVAFVRHGQDAQVVVHKQEVNTLTKVWQSPLLDPSLRFGRSLLAAGKGTPTECKAAISTAMGSGRIIKLDLTTNPEYHGLLIPSNVN